MKKVLSGNHAAAVAARLARVQVAAGYPITPATQVFEALAEMRAKGEFPGEFIAAESEHSVMAALLGAATAGARTFTATSSHGLAYMHELLHWVAGARLPVVMVDVNRALAAPWNLGTDQTDSLSQRDTGWMQTYCSNNQEVLDTVLMSFKIAERVMLPSMVVLDGFTLSHSYEPVDVPKQAEVDAFLPPFRPVLRLDPDQPMSFGSLTGPKDYLRLRRRMAADLAEAEDAIEEVGREFGELFGRPYGQLDAYRCEDAETVLVTSGAVGSTARAAVDALRERGLKAGNLRLRAFRPFPARALRAFVRPGTRLAVVDRNLSPGAGGIFASEIKAALYPRSGIAVHGYVTGLGGGDISVELLQEVWERVDAARGADPAPAVWAEDAR
ncbi:MAG: pyruvate ferredoxin oxidoreductase [Elusimicrobia bacterium]|nr:pyruvate ferredoxin oxidoreductase [Elusimicrobiota bacterium]